MKSILAALIGALLLAAPTFAVGTVTQTLAWNDTKTQMTLTFSWTGDSLNGSVPATAVSAANLTSLYGFYLLQVETDPGSTAPSADYDITITDASGLDLMDGRLANRSATATEVGFPSVLSRPTDSTFTLNITNQNVASATGTAKLYFSKTPAAPSIVEGHSSMTPILVSPGTADAPEGSPATNPPVPVSAKARASEVAAVDSGDEVRPTATTTGGLIFYGPALPGDTWQYPRIGETGVIENTGWAQIVAPAATYYQCATLIYVQNSDATVATVFTIYDDDNGDVNNASVLWSGYAAALGGGGRIGDGTAPVVCSKTAGNGLYFVATTTSSECRVTARGFRTKVAPTY